ncbi:hypothetical protein FA13DRAFT_1797514 [Coprinellus micaceus]|uniref:Uncharacterized protein n=1 Tax=Coprinellus micaceus TaxID=71717 RepID=A0A4Y7SQJ6_COPMI|nr:hypothetical protein FA13DRAFT_1797514 [Coprinellus micaceus]
MSTVQDNIQPIKTTAEFDEACKAIERILAYPKKLIVEGELGLSRRRDLVNQVASVLTFCSEAGTFHEGHLGLLLYNFLEECIQQEPVGPEFDLDCAFLQQELYVDHVRQYHKPPLTLENAPQRPRPSTAVSAIIPTSQQKFGPPIGARREPSTRTGSSIGSGGGKRKHIPSEDEDGVVDDDRPAARPKGKSISKPNAKRARSQAGGLGVAPSTSITGPSSAGGSSQDQLAQAINYVAEAATFVEGLDKEAVA